MARVLVIDDSPTAVHFVRSVLAQDGHEVLDLESFVDLPKVLRSLPEILRNQPPDVVLLDLELPSLHGRSFARFIRQFERDSIPILIYSGRPREELEETAKESAAAGIIEKGASAEELRRTVLSVVSGR